MRLFSSHPSWGGRSAVEVHPRVACGRRLPFVLVSAAAALTVIVAPLVGQPPVVRLSAVLVPVLAIGWWTWRVPPGYRALMDRSKGDRFVLCVAAGLTGALLAWIVLTRFMSGEINAVDFTIYFDRPLFQTSIGRPLYVETTDDARFSHLTHLAVHAYWALLPLSLLYKVHATPLWLLALSVVAVVAGAVYIFRIGRHLGWGGPLSAAAAFVAVFNDNTARTLNYGFHAEILYAWFVPWALHAALRRDRVQFLCAVAACVLVKEDAIFPLTAASATLALVHRNLARSDRLLFVALPPALALANLLLYYEYVVPALSRTGDVMYSYFWEGYGRTPTAVLLAMAGNPGRVLRDAAGSGFVPVVLLPFLLLPLAGWRWSLGTLPLVLVYGASSSEQVRSFGIYYAIPLVPFCALAAADGARNLTRWTRRPQALRWAAPTMVLGALLVGGGYSLRPWRAEIAALPAALSALPPGEVVLVQSGLYPHAGYDPRTKLLSPDTLADPANAGATILLAEGISAFPFAADDVKRLMQRPRIAELGRGITAVRLNQADASAEQKTAEVSGPERRP